MNKSKIYMIIPRINNVNDKKIWNVKIKKGINGDE